MDKTFLNIFTNYKLSIGKSLYTIYINYNIVHSLFCISAYIYDIYVYVYCILLLYLATSTILIIILVTYYKAVLAGI